MGGLAVGDCVDGILGDHVLPSVKGDANGALYLDGTVLTIHDVTCAAGSDGKLLRRAGGVVDECLVPRFIVQTVEQHRSLAVRCGHREGGRPLARLHWEFLLRR